MAVLTSDIQINDKLVSVAGFVIDRLGLHYFAEMTSASIVGVVLAAHGKTMTYRDAHDHLGTFGVFIKDHQQKRLVRQGCADISTIGHRIHAGVPRPVFARRSAGEVPTVTHGNRERAVFYFPR